MNTYVFILGVRVSGYVQYICTRTLAGDSVDEAFNAEFLERSSLGDWVVMEVHKITYTSMEEWEYTGKQFELRRII